jgi:hypothetical protein
MLSSVIPIDSRALCKIEDHSGGVKERFVNVVGGLGAGLEKGQSMLGSKLPSFFLGNFTLRLQIGLVANQHNDNIFVGKVLTIFEPRRQMLKCFAASNIIDQQCT